MSGAVYGYGCVYPLEARMKTKPEALDCGYGLESKDMHLLAAQMRGIPITVEHHGIEGVVSELIQSQKALIPINVTNALDRGDDVKSMSVGRVIEAEVTRFQELCIVFVMDRLPSVQWLVEQGFMRGLSLTHIESSTHGMVPLEVSLCSEPARPGCYVEALGTKEQVEAYKRRRGLTNVVAASRAFYQRGTMSTGTPQETTPVSAAAPSVVAETPDAATPATRIEQVLSQLSEEESGLIKARLTDMMKRCDNESSARMRAEENAKSALEEARKAQEQTRFSGAEAGMLRDQLLHLQSQLGDKLSQNFMVTPDKCGPLFENDAQAVRRVTDRLLCAANHRLMAYRAQYGDIGQTPVSVSQEKSVSSDNTMSMPAEPVVTTAQESMPALVEPVPRTTLTAASVSATGSRKRKVADTELDSPENLLQRAISDAFEI